MSKSGGFGGFDDDGWEEPAEQKKAPPASTQRGRKDSWGEDAPAARGKGAKPAVSDDWGDDGGFDDDGWGAPAPGKSAPKTGSSSKGSGPAPAKDDDWDW